MHAAEISKICASTASLALDMANYMTDDMQRKTTQPFQQEVFSA